MNARFVLALTLVTALQASASDPGAIALSQRDGQHDFDFEVGTWSTHVRRRVRPLTGSTTWVEMKGTTVVRKVWNGGGVLVELQADGPGGRFEGLSLRLYNPQSRQWSLNFANRSDGVLTPPTIGQFKDGLLYVSGLGMWRRVRIGSTGPGVDLDQINGRVAVAPNSGSIEDVDQLGKTAFVNSRHAWLRQWGTSGAVL